MCRNIKRIRRDDPPPTMTEVEAGAYHLVSKVSGYSKPSKANAEAFAQAVDEIVGHTLTLLNHLEIDGKKPCVEILKS